MRSALLRLTSVLFLFAVVATAFAVDDKGSKVNFAAGLNHAEWDTLLKKYVDNQGLVAYEAWKNNAADLKALDAYLGRFAAKGEPAKGDDLAASAINAYNAFAIRRIISNYPTESIQEIKNVFSDKVMEIGGEKVALNDIEHGTLRPLLGYRAHPALVCCARSCPPLQRSAYRASDLNAQIDTAYETWLARKDMNQYDPDQNKVEISSIFKWFKTDFDKAGGVEKILARYAPQQYRSFLQRGGYKIEYKTYNWGLNDQGSHGRHYSSLNLYLDKIF
jgi:hypothetical protein